jgi:hypothetical protein
MIRARFIESVMTTDDDVLERSNIPLNSCLGFVPFHSSTSYLLARVLSCKSEWKRMQYDLKRVLLYN